MRTMRTGLVLCLLLIVGCSSLPWQAQPLRISLAGITPGKAGTLERQYLLKLRIQNPNEKDIEIDGLACEMDLNGRRFARAVSNQKTLLPRFGEAQLEVVAVANLASAEQQLAALQDSSSRSVRYRLRGKVSAGRMLGELPFDHQDNIALSALAGKTP